MTKDERKDRVAARSLRSDEGSAAAVPFWRRVAGEPVALGLAPLIVLRPILDGITYPTDNFYFVWWLAFLFALLATRMLLRGEGFRFQWAILLLAAFWGVALVTALDSVQFDATNRTLIIWTGHFFLFVLASNGLRSRTALGIVLGAFAASLLVESVWSLVHLKYVIPFMREAVAANPRLLQEYFGTGEMSPELFHRLMVNRAFGTLLFPNALAAFLIVGIPFSACGSLLALRDLAELLREGRIVRETRVKPPKGGAPASGLRGGSKQAMYGIAGAVLLVTFAAAYFLFYFAAEFESPLPPGWTRSLFLPLIHSPASGYQWPSAAYVLLWIAIIVALPAGAFLAAALVVRRYGVAVFGLALRLWILPPLVVLQTAALWLTYSRGGVLALFGAVAFTTALLAFAWLRGSGAVRAAAVAATLAAAIFVSSSRAGWAEPAGNASAAAQTPPPTLAQQITREGKHLSAQDLMNPSSFRLRLGYWRTGWAMAKDNFWTGVGLGNFGTAYPKYQLLDATDVKATHNDYLQALCETGIFGFLAFCGFWASIVLWGAWRLWREPSWTERLALGGLYAGLLAFLAHSLLDFNFFNPSLAFFAFLIAGVFLARASVDAPAVGGGIRYQLLALPMLVMAALVAGRAAQIYCCDLIIGNWSWLSVGNHRRMNVAWDAGVFFMPPANSDKKVANRVKDLYAVLTLVPNRSVLETVGSLWVPSPGSKQGYRALRPGEPFDLSSTIYVLTATPAEVRLVGRRYIELWLDELRQADGIYPHNPDLAGYFTQFYDLLVRQTLDAEEKRRYVIDLVQWSEEGLRRCPDHFLYHEFLGRAYWYRAFLERGAEKYAYLDKSIEEYRRAAELYPVSGDSFQQYAQRVIDYGTVLGLDGEKAKSEARTEEGKKLMERAQEIYRARTDALNPSMPAETGGKEASS